jgi:hypothetical protein
MFLSREYPKLLVDKMSDRPFSGYSDAPEDYRILKSQWEMVENVLNSLGKFGPGVNEEGEETLGDYRAMEAEAKVGLGEEEVVILRTRDPEVKKLLFELDQKSREPALSKVDPTSTLPRLRENAIKPLGETVHYEEYETVMVAPMDAKTVRKAFEHYEREYRELNGFRKMDEQLPGLREKLHYTLKETRVRVKGRVESHTMIIPSEDPQRRAEFDRAMNSGEIPLGNELYTMVLQPQGQADAGGDAGKDAGREKAKRR